jgi:hypothetical protein
MIETKHKRPSVLGTTFSQLQCNFLNISYQECCRDVATLPFNAIRVCAYWEEIEKTENVYSYEILDYIVTEFSKKEIQIILTVGIKSPRWPEFHIPKWLRDKYNTTHQDIAVDSFSEIATKAYQFTENTVCRYKDNPHIKYFLIENEGLNNAEFTNGRHISHAFIHSEIDLVRRLKRPDQKIMCTNAIELSLLWADDKYALRQNLHLADAVGINVYTKIPKNNRQYIEPTFLFWMKLKNWRNKIIQKGCEPWITESQAEPWELHDGKGSAIHINEKNYPSSSPQSSVKLASKLTKIGFNKILLWGCEHWYWHKKNGNNEWWNEIEKYSKG